MISEPSKQFSFTTTLPKNGRGASHQFFIIRSLLAGVVSLLVVSTGHAQFWANHLPGGWKAKGVVIPFYIGTDPQPTVIFRVERIYTDHQRKGFFRIGALPIAVMEGVTLEIRSLDSLTNSLVQLHQWLGPQAANRLELRRATIHITMTATNHLQVGRVHVAPGGKWALLDGVCYSAGTNQIQATSGTLQVAGEHTGELVMATLPPLIKNLFAQTTATEQPIQRASHEN